MRLIENRHFTLTILAILGGMAAGVGILCGNTPDLESLYGERSRLYLEIAKQRIHLLETNEELKEINKKILKLQKQLIEGLEADITMKQLKNTFNQVQEQIDKWEKDTP